MLIPQGLARLEQRQFEADRVQALYTSISGRLTLGA
jgi:hypothetical protein